MNSKFEDNFKPKNVNFVVDEFEEVIMQDILQNDHETLKKLKRDVTDMFMRWIETKIKQKENISINVKGETRSGKSLIALKLASLISSYYEGKVFDTEKIVCANQKEYRQKLRKAEFGDVYQIDENTFTNVGIGSVSETQQLKDVQNIIAKKNIHTIYITPRNFLNTNSRLGLSFYGKDINNWISRFLVYDLRGSMPVLLGYIKINVGTLFTNHGCYIFKLTGGCTNPKKLGLKDIPKDYIENSSCIKKDTMHGMKHGGTNCPFYFNCKHPLNLYEVKKDKWIEAQMSGSLDERTLERYEVALKLFQIFVVRVELETDEGTEESFKIKAKNRKELLIKLKMKIPTITNSQYTGTEIEEICSLIFAMLDLDFFKDICKNLETDYKKELSIVKNE